MKIISSKPRPARGITLIEVLVLLCVAAIGAFLIVEQKIFAGMPISAGQTSAAKLFVAQEIDTPFKSYKLDTGNYPTTAQGLMALVAVPPGINGWHGPYLKTAGTPLDPWNHPYHYTFPAIHNPKDKYDCWSSGPDGISGTKDDIGNW